MIKDSQNIRGLRELSLKLSEMGKAVGGKALRAAVMEASQPALNAARSNFNGLNRKGPPYFYEVGGVSVKKDPYPTRTYKGNLKTPGFAARNIRRRSIISKDKQTAKVMIGVRKEAFYAINFIEFGTSKIAKTPWLEPALRASIPSIDERLKLALKKQIDKAARK